VGPAQVSTQQRDYRLVLEDFREANHVEQVALPETAPELRHQFCTQRVHYLFPVAGTLSLEDVLADSSPHIPVKHDQRGVDRARHVLPGDGYQLAQIIEQGLGAGGQLRANFPFTHSRSQVIPSLSNLPNVETLPVIIAVNQNRLAHLIQPTPQAHTNTIL
jgi:hypothetical protein